MQRVYGAARALGVALLISAFPSYLRAQAPDPSTKDLQARRDELAKAAEMVADPDPLQRLANMESIINSHDALKIQVALRASLSSDDTELRALGMSAYIASIKQINFDVHLSPADQRRYDSYSGDRPQMQNLPTTYNYLAQLDAVNFELLMTFTDFDMNSKTGIVAIDSHRTKFVISGDRLAFREDVAIGSSFQTCTVEFRPTRDLTLEGTMNCDGWPRVTLSANLF